MTKSELVERLLKKGARGRGEAVRVVETVFECLEKALRQGARIEIRGLGSFCVRSYQGYQGRNPKTGEPIAVKPKRLPYFKPSKTFVQEINKSITKPAPPSAAGQRRKADLSQPAARIARPDDSL
jgi:integration host factor subunit beta